MEFTISLPTAILLFVVLGTGIYGIGFSIKKKNWRRLIPFLITGPVFGAIGYGGTYGVAHFVEQAENDRKIFATMQQPWKDLHLYLNKANNNERKKRTVQVFEEKYSPCGVWNTNCTCNIPISPEQAEMFKRTVGERDGWKVHSVLEKCIQVNLEDELATAKKKKE